MELKTLGFVLLCALVFVLLGRSLVVRKSELSEQGLSIYHPFPNFTAGLSVWYFSFLTFCAFGSMSVENGWWLFLALACLFIFVKLFSFRMGEEVERFWVKTFFTTLWVLPALLFASGDVPLQAHEMEGLFKLSESLYLENAFPAVWEAEMAQGASAAKGFAYAVATLPVSFFTGAYAVSAFALTNVLLLIFSASMLLYAMGVTLKWSNMALATVGAAVGITLLNPFFDVAELLSATETYFVSALVLSVLLPLLTKDSLPQGYGALPFALALALLMGVDINFAYFAVFVVLLWIFQIVAEKRTVSVADFGAIFLMAMIPLAAVLMWQNLTGAEVERASLELFRETFSANIAQMWALSSVQLALVGFAFLALLVELPTLKSGFGSFVRNSGAFYIPPLLVLFILLFPVYSVGFSLPHAQFVLLIPLWWFARYAYEASRVKEAVFRAPWQTALAVAFTFVLVQLSSASQLKERYTPALSHTFEVAETLRSEVLRKGQQVVVLGGESEELYARSLSYALRGRGEAQLYVPREKETLTNLYINLGYMGASYVWVHQPNSHLSSLLGVPLKGEHSYLFEVGQETLILKSVFKHVGY